MRRSQSSAETQDSAGRRGTDISSWGRLRPGRDHCSGEAGGSLGVLSCNWLGSRLNQRTRSAPGSRGRGGALTSPPLPPAAPRGRSREKRQRDPPQLPAVTPRLGSWLPGHVLTNLASPRPSLQTSCALSPSLLVLKLSRGREPLGRRPPESRQHWRRIAICLGDMLKIQGRQSWYFEPGS